MLKASLSSPTCSIFSKQARQSRNATSLKIFRTRINGPGIGVHLILSKYQRNAHLIKINRILLHVDQLLAKGKWDIAWQYFHSKLTPADELEVGADKKVDGGLTTNTTRFQAYEHAVSLFASYHRFHEAMDIHDRMIDEGFIPSLSTRTKIMAYSLIRGGTNAENLFGALEQAAFKEAEYDEKSLFQLIRFLGDTMSFSPSSIDQVVESWSKYHGVVSSSKTLTYLVHLHTRDGLLQDAQNWLQVHANQAAEKGHAPDPAPYTSFLSALAHTRFRSSEILSKLITRIQKDGVTPDLALFNSLISSQIVQGQPRKAFETYELLYQFRGRDLTPDAFTFSSLFKAADCVRRQPTASAELRYMPKPRDLYNNLLECHLIRSKGKISSPSSTLNPLVLNLALQTFMTCNDYPGAYVILQSFRQCNVKANSNTGCIVVKTLLRRVRKESRLYSGKVSRAWSGKFLGNQRYQVADVNESLFTVSDEEIIKRILSRAEPPPNKPIAFLDSTLSAKPSLLHSTVISNTMNNRSTFSHMDLVSLKRIVRRAFLSDSGNPYGAAYQLDQEDITPTKAFSLAIVKAKNMMIPNGDTLKNYFTSGKAGTVDRRQRVDFRLLSPP